MATCNGPVKGNNSASGLEKVNLYCFFTGWSCKDALDGGGIAPVVATISQKGLRFLLTMRGSVYIKC